MAPRGAGFANVSSLEAAAGVKAPPPGALGVRVGARRRKAREGDVLEQLLAVGWPAEVAARREPATLSAAQAVIERLVANGLGFERAADGERLFDPSEVGNFIQWASLERGEPFWLEQSLPLGRRVLLAAHRTTPEAIERLPSPMTLPPRRFSVTFRRRFDLSDREPGTPVRLRLPLPLESGSLGDLSVFIDAMRGAEFLSAEGRLDVRLTTPADGAVELGYQAAFVARPNGGMREALTDEDAALYTRPREGIVKVDADARALAESLAGPGDGWSQVLRFWDFIARELRFGIVNYDEIDRAHPWRWLLANRWSDCQLGSALMVSLCRARGMPARMLSGYLLDEQTPYHHYWSEIWLPDRGWTPFDTAGWALSGGGRDRDWLAYYVGEVDYRMTTERLPRLFNGAGAARFPPAVTRLSRLAGGGLETRYFDADRGALIYADRVAILSAEDA